MKKKSLLLAVIAFTSLGLVGCDGTKTSGTVKDSTSQSQFLEDDSNITLRGATTFEVNQTITYRFSVANAVRNKLVKVSLEANDVAGILQTDGTVDYEANGVSSVKVFGVSEGTIKRKVTSVETGNSKTFTLTVTAAKPTLKEALQSLASATNYTFIGQPEDESLKTDKNTTIVKRNENSIIVTHGDGSNVLIGTPDNGDDSSVAGYARYGIAKNKDDEYYYLDKSITYTDENHKETTVSSDLCSPAFVASLPGIGFFNKDNFAGSPDCLTSAWQSQFVIPSFSWMNPNWVNSEKSDDNHYELNGESPDYDQAKNLITNMDAVNDAYLEYILWNLVDPAGRQYNWALKGQANLFTFSSWIDTSIDVLGDNAIKVTISPTSGSGLKSYDNSDYPTMVGIVSNVGNTAVDSGFADFIASNPDAVPSTLGGQMNAVKDALNSESFVVTNYISYSYNGSNGKKTYGDLPYNIYYTQDYKIYEVPQESKDEYLANTGKEFETLGFPDKKGYGRTKNGSVYSISYTPAKDSEEAKFTLGKQIVDISNQPLMMESMTRLGENGSIFNDSLGNIAYMKGSLHSFSSKQENFWSSSAIPSGFTSESSDAYDLFLGFINGYSLDDMHSEDGFNLPTNFGPIFIRHADFADSDDIRVTKLSFCFGLIDSEAGSGYPLIFQSDISGFGTAKSSYDTLIKAALAA